MYKKEAPGFHPAPRVKHYLSGPTHEGVGVRVVHDRRHRTFNDHRARALPELLRHESVRRQHECERIRRRQGEALFVSLKQLLRCSTRVTRETMDAHEGQATGAAAVAVSTAAGAGGVVSTQVPTRGSLTEAPLR